MQYPPMDMAPAELLQSLSKQAPPKPQSGDEKDKPPGHEAAYSQHGRKRRLDGDGGRAALPAGTLLCWQHVISWHVMPCYFQSHAT